MTTLSWGDYLDDKRCQGRNGEVLHIEEGTGDAQDKKEAAPKGGVERGADPKPGCRCPAKIKVLCVQYTNGREKGRNRSFTIKEVGSAEGDA